MQPYTYIDGSRGEGQLRPDPTMAAFTFFTSHLPLRISAVRLEEKSKVSPPPPPLPTDKKTTSAKTMTTTTRPPARLSLPALACKALDDLINNFFDSPRPSTDPRRVLAGNYAPVDELPPTACVVTAGALPPCLDGVYVRNGPNPRHLPRGPYHLFDGDGMLHALRIAGGRATLASRFVRTYKFAVEEAAGAQVIPNFFASFHGYAGVARGAVAAARFLSGQFDLTRGFGPANTSVAYFAGRFFALAEADLPYEVRLAADGDIATVGRCDFGGKLSVGMTAHPKIDADTGEVFAFRYGPVPPFLTYFRFDAAGEKQPDVPIFSLLRPSLIHDFAVTKRFAVFVDSQIVMNPTDMILAGGSPVGADPAKVSRIGFLPRYAADESDIRWFDVPGFNIMHAINAWDDDDDDGGEAVVLVAPNLVSVQHTLDRMHLLHCAVEKVRIDLRTGIVRRTPVTAANLEFGVINPAYAGKRSRYCYLGTGDPMPNMTGVAKLDLEDASGNGVVARREFGPGCSGGEPFFVGKGGEEDDGYVVNFVYDEREGASRFLVMDAKSPELEVVASVLLPARVPHGFHGLFVPESELLKQQRRPW